jgi:hypothetical protein
MPVRRHSSRRGGLRPGSGRPKGSVVPIEMDSQKFEIAGLLALVEEGYGPFDAARRALLAIRGGAFKVEDIEGLLQVATAEIPLPQPFDPLDRDKGLRRFAAKARRVTKRQPASEWLNHSAGAIGALIDFVRDGNQPGMSAAIDKLIELGWAPVIQGFVWRIEAALGSNLAPADVERLGPAARRWLAELRQQKNERLKK